MILITDSGSTKTNWIAINNKGEQLFKTKTKGLNPAVFKSKVLEKRIRKNDELFACKEVVTKIHFYGAGCGTKTPRIILHKVLESFFPNAEIFIKEDTEAAVFSVTTKPAIVCILGTGSNCSYFDGKITHQKITSLGYIIMDECSGNYFGKILLRDYFFHKMPEDFAEGFALNYNLDSDHIKKNLYREDNPNTYLAGFSHYLIHHKNCDYAQKVIYRGLELFIENQILQYNESKKLPIHFIGSLAFYLEDEIKSIFKKYNLKLGKIERRPIDGLVQYHIKLNK
ncbi:MAG: N-acetylglucosamine kinase [Flavobacteriaceae bacterium]